MKYTALSDGEWTQPKRRGFKLVCCDCNLVHTFDFRIYRGRVQFRAFRDKRDTARRRRNEAKSGT